VLMLPENRAYALFANCQARPLASILALAIIS
jgi:hypothetical protein